MRFEVIDISAQTLGKYQYCTKDNKTGLWFADADFANGFGGGEIKRGALPSPRQDTPELRALALRMHEEAANALMAKTMVTEAVEDAEAAEAAEAKRPTIFAKLKGILSRSASQRKLRG